MQLVDVFEWLPSRDCLVRAKYDQEEYRKKEKAEGNGSSGITKDKGSEEKTKLTKKVT